MGFEDKDFAKRACHHIIEQATRKQVDFLLFPEMTLTGFTMNPADFAEELHSSPSLRFFQEKAMQNNIAIGFGMAVKENNTFTNHCIFLDKSGKMIADYRKIHPFSYGAEARYYTGGDKIVSCQLEGINIVPFTCYDLRFPEIFQIASEKATIITVIANWPVTRRDHWITLLKARAIENQCFVIGVNRTGAVGRMEYPGDSMAISPTGEILAHSRMGEGLAIAEIYPAQANAYRDSFPLKADRKPELYHQLWQNKHM